MGTRVILSSMFAGAILISTASRAAVFEGLGFLPGGSCSEATAVSDDGSVVVGTSCTASGVQAFIWNRDSGIAPIPIPAPLTETWATAVSADAGYVACYGRQSSSPPYGYEAFRWRTGGTVDRIPAEGLDIVARGISGDGSVVVGTSWADGTGDEAFRWTSAGGLERLASVAGGAVRTNAEAISTDGLVIVGDRIYEGPPYRDCFHWTADQTVAIAAHTASAVSADGSVVVGAIDNQQTALFEAYRWTAQSGLTLLGTPLANFHSRALGVSADGSIVVGYVQNNSGFDEQKAFIWDADHGMRLLQHVLEDDYGLDLSDWGLDEPWASWKAAAISADGSTIVGVATNSAGQQEAWRAILRGPVNVEPGVIYVDADATGIGDGSSWTDACNHLQDALAEADSAPKPVEVRVAAGTYRPDLGEGLVEGDVEASFILANGVAIRGGYAGDGAADPDARNIEAHPTVLSGDLAGNDRVVSEAVELLDEPTRADNSYHVIRAHNTDETAVLDGLTITAGNSNNGYWIAYYGGGITADQAGFSAVDCTIIGNVAAQGGGLQIGSGGANLTRCKLIANAAYHAGGMINGGGATTLVDCNFVDNYADTSGGATICNYADFTRCSFVGNRAGASTGGAVGNDCSAPHFTDCRFIDNHCPNAGGAISNYEGDLVIIGCTFIGNSADNGGGIYQGDTETLLRDCTFIDNQAVTGGGVSNDGYSEPNLINCTFQGNRADTGGGFYNTTGSRPLFIDCRFIANDADLGAGLASENNYLFSPVLRDCAFTGNIARSGGGLYSDDTSLLAEDCTFVSNRASDEGGGIYLLTGTATLTRCTLTANHADTDGGGMQNDAGTPMLTECIFSGNTADDEGAGLCNEAEVDPSLGGALTKCLFVGNIAGGHGGGFCSDSTNPTVTNCTFSDNVASAGGAVYSESDTPLKLLNCIAWADEPDEIHSSSTSTIVAYSNIDGGWPGPGNMNADPLFAQPGYREPNGTPANTDDDLWIDGDYHLASQGGRWSIDQGQWMTDETTSPCIDAGNPMGAIGLEPFPNGGRINMGAYGGTDQASKSYFGQPPCQTIIAGDINGDCRVDFIDFCFIAANWMREM